MLAALYIQNILSEMGIDKPVIDLIKSAISSFLGNPDVCCCTLIYVNLLLDELRGYTNQGTIFLSILKYRLKTYFL